MPQFFTFMEYIAQRNAVFTEMARQHPSLSDEALLRLAENKMRELGRQSLPPYTDGIPLPT